MALSPQRRMPVSEANPVRSDTARSSSAPPRPVLDVALALALALAQFWLSSVETGPIAAWRNSGPIVVSIYLAKTSAGFSPAFAKASAGNILWPFKQLCNLKFIRARWQEAMKWNYILQNLMFCRSCTMMNNICQRGCVALKVVSEINTPSAH